MPDTPVCLVCGTPLPRDAPEGFCPRCSFGGALEVQTADRGQKSEGSSPAMTDNSPLAPHPLSLGTGVSFGEYELLEEIGCGGMGMVYKARQRSLNRIVALKLLLFGPHASQESVKRFRAEAVATAALHHPNIVAIHEVGLSKGQHFLVMDFVDGPSLAKLIGHQPLPAQRAAACVQAIAEAIHYAHECGILHRDLKPSNILIDANDQPRVTDFGLAKRLADSHLSTPDPQLTLTGQVLGSPNYMPPEQASGQRGALSRRTDVYALGAILYHALTGRPPFVAEGMMETVQQVLNVEPVSPRVFNPSVPADLETVCLKCLEKEPGKRYATAQMLAEELGRFLNGQPVLARPIGRVGKTWRWCRRNPRLALATSAAFLSLLIGLAGVTWQWRRAEAGELLARQRGYVSDMSLAQQALKANNPGRALELLNRYRLSGSPLVSRLSPPAFDLRGFEWRYLWQQSQSEAEAVVGRLPSGIRSLEASADGQWLVAGSEGGAVTLWNLSTREKILLSAEPGIRALATFSPDSRVLLFSDQSQAPVGTIAVWDLQARTRLAPIKDAGIVGPMVFSPDGRWVEFGVLRLPNRDPRGVLVDFAKRQPVVELNVLTRRTDFDHGFDWVFTRDGRSGIFSENDPDRRIVVCDFAAGSEPHYQYFTGHVEAITTMAISPDGQILATGAGYTDKTIKFWQVPTIQPLGELAGHGSWIRALKFSPDGRTLASASADQTVRLWDVGARKTKRIFQRLPGEVWRVCFAPDGRKLFTGGADGTIHRWAADAEPAQSEPGFSRRPTGLDSFMTVAPDGRQFAGVRRAGLYAGEMRGRGVYVGEVQGAVPPAPIPELGTNNTHLLISTDGQSLFAGTQSGEIQIWPLDRRQPCVLHGFAEPVRSLRQDMAGRILVAVFKADAFLTDHPWRVEVWNVATRQQQQTWSIPAPWSIYASSEEVSPDGLWLATTEARGPVRLWSLAGRSEPRIAPASARNSNLAFSPDGRLLAGVGPEGIVTVWEMPSLRKLTSFLARPRPLTPLAFSSDSRRLALAGEHEIKFWDVATWQELLMLECQGEPLTGLDFSADGQQLLARTSKGDLLVWRVPSLAEIAQRENQQAGAK
jgi:eukaryotic-like serine/threonine-protein kinase